MPPSPIHVPPSPLHDHARTSPHCVWPVMTFTVFVDGVNFQLFFRWMKVYTIISLCRPLYSIRQQAFTLYFVLLFVSAVSGIVLPQIEPKIDWVTKENLRYLRRTKNKTQLKIVKKIEISLSSHWISSFHYMNWEFAEYCLSKFYTESRAVSTEDATWLFHNLPLLLLLLLPFAGTCSCSLGTRRANESENALNLNSHSHFFLFLPFVLRILHNGCAERRGEGGRKTAPKYSEKKLDRSTRAQVGPIEGQYSGHARELVNRFIARLVDRSIGRREKGGRRDL